MEIKVIKKEVVIRHKLKRGENYRIQKGKKFESVTFLKTPQVVSGFSNMCEDNRGILCIDYDNCDKCIVEEDYRSIQAMYGLPQAFLFSTRDLNFHVICLKKFLSSKIYEILLHTRADENYKSMPLRTPYRSWVLRLSGKKGSGKPKFLGMIGEMKNLQYEVSKAHLSLLNKLYKLPKINYKKIGKCHKIKLQLYETSR